MKKIILPVASLLLSLGYMATVQAASPQQCSVQINADLCVNQSLDPGIGYNLTINVLTVKDDPTSAIASMDGGIGVTSFPVQFSCEPGKTYYLMSSWTLQYPASKLMGTATPPLGFQRAFSVVPLAVPNVPPVDGTYKFASTFPNDYTDAASQFPHCSKSQ